MGFSFSPGYSWLQTLSDVALNNNPSHWLFLSGSLMEKGNWSVGFRKPDYLYHLFVVWPWARHFTSLSFCFLIHKTRIITLALPTSWDFRETEVGRGSWWYFVRIIEHLMVMSCLGFLSSLTYIMRSQLPGEAGNTNIISSILQMGKLRCRLK